MHTNHIKAKATLDDNADRVIIQWIRNRNGSYDVKGYPSQSPEQSMLPSQSYFIPEETEEEKRCEKAMTELSHKKPEVFNTAIFEYFTKDYWIAKCREHGGWTGVNSNVFTPVDEPRKRHFIGYLTDGYGIQKDQYYRRLRTLKNTIIVDVL